MFKCKRSHENKKMGEGEGAQVSFLKFQREQGGGLCKILEGGREEKEKMM